MVKSTYNGIDVYSAKSLIIGSGAAGLSLAVFLKEMGFDDFLLFTESIKAGTSLNTGSDKQTYYKLSLSGSERDSVRLMAEDLYRGKCVDGDIALAEASSSVRCFMRLVELGCEFPYNSYGEYVGYKTDHDNYHRATSLGPYTSKRMVECLLKRAKELGVEIFSGFQAVRLLRNGDRIEGALFIERKSGRLSLVLSPSVTLATGGPSGIYKSSVYPESQFGSSSLAFDIGVRGKNLTEWQFGLSSTRPRWNVSGSYMQALPRFISIDGDGKERNFLLERIKDIKTLSSLVFLKGYQWPFDARKASGGSSYIDLLVYEEQKKGRRVYLDYRRNISDAPFDPSLLSSEAYEYLSSSGALLSTPIERLKALNLPSYEFYRDKGVDLERVPLEIALSVQHNNGGLEGDANWETSVKGLFIVGEANGTHGVYRPGGSALNAGQVGALRAAERISSQYRNAPYVELSGSAEEALRIEKEFISQALGKGEDFEAYYDSLRSLMSDSASVIRERGELERALHRVNDMISSLKSLCASSSERLWLFYEYRNALFTSRIYLSAMIDYAKRSGKSRGSAIYVREDGEEHIDLLDTPLRYTLEGDDEKPDIQTVYLKDGEVIAEYRRARDIPGEDESFERVWREFRERKGKN